MGRWIGFWMAIVIGITLAGCSGEGAPNGDQVAIEVRSAYLSMTACEATLNLTADYGERIYEYKLSMDYVRNGETRLTILEPENVAGISARVTTEGTTLEYDGMTLETGPMDAEGLSPISAIPVLLDTIIQGYIAETSLEPWGDAELLRVVCRDPDVPVGTGREIILWFNPQGATLLQGEILSDGHRVILCSVESFSMTRQGTTGEG